MSSLPPKSLSPPGSSQDSHNFDTQHLDLEICQCHDTGKCICALKSDATDSQPIQFMAPPTSSRRPRLFQTPSSEAPHMTVFANGHHKPVHRNNNAAHECGVPYRIPNFHPPAVPFKVAAHRSTESLPTMDSLEKEAAAAVQTPGILNGTTIERRMSKSEHTSPLIRPFVNTPPSDGPGSLSQPATASLDIPYLSGSLAGETTTSWIDTNFSSRESDVGLLSATSLGPDMWSWTGNDLPLGNRSRSESDPLSWANAHNGLPSQPALTHASSSGPQSEIEDPFSFDDAVLAQMSGPPSTGSQPVGSTEVNTWDNLNLTENLNLNESVNNRWSMPSFPGLEVSSLNGNSNGSTPFPELQKSNSSQQMNINIGNERPAPLQQSSISYNDITSQPRSSSSLAVPGNQAVQASLGNTNDLNSSTAEWLKDLGKDLGLDYGIDDSQMYGGNANNLPLDSGLDTSNSMPMDNVLSINDFQGDDYTDATLLPPTTSANKSTYAQPHGVSSWNNSSTSVNDMPNPWLS
ncbi:MAG: hypothetical protein M1822_008643 [Bathelium mastoideum]|nr:MAG: hypothetical protein M1822_008643 [Bathelium mastoideum]